MSLEDKIVALAETIGTDVRELINGKMDKGLGGELSNTNFTQAEKTKLEGIATEATKNRDDSENADKLHTHEFSEVAGLDTALADKASKTELNAELALKADKVEGKVFSDTNFTQAEKDKLASLENYSDTNPFTDVEKTKLNDIAAEATKNRADSENADKEHTHELSDVNGLDTALESKASKTELTDGLALKVDKVVGKGLSDTNFTQAEKDKLADLGNNTDNSTFTNDEKVKLAGIAVGATKNRADSANADKTHTHTTAQVTGLDTALAGKADKTTQVSAGTGLTGGGTLASNRTLNVSYGTTAGTATQGNDVRINNGQTAFGWGNHASAGYAKTKADVGLSGIPNTNASTTNFLRGDGTWVTPPNTSTTYTEITTAEIDAGTASTLRTVSGRRMKYALDKKADTGTQVIAGTGLTGGGTLAANRTLAVSYGTTAGTAAQGNDSRIVNAVPNSRTITAGTGLTGGGNLTANRTLAVSYGTTTGTAAQGNDSRITGALQSSQVVQVTGTSTTNVMSQKAVTDVIANIPSVPKTAAYTVAAVDKGKSIDTTTNVTIRASVFTVGDVLVVTNTSATVSSILAASGVTIRLAGSATTGTRTLAGYGVATLRMVSNNVWFASGAGLS